MLIRGESYETVYDTFKWQIPERYNIGLDICDRQADLGHGTALIFESEKGSVDRYSFSQLKDLSNRFANALKAVGISTGDRVGILLPQCPETAVAHIAVYKIGGVAVPLFTLFGPDALSYRLDNSGARCLITNRDSLGKILEIREQLPQLEQIFVTDGEAHDVAVNFWDALRKGSARFDPIPTRAEDPALIIYTSGTTGPPKGALHAHRTLLGHLPGVEFPHNFFPRENDLFWTPADWAWIGGLIDVLFPAWHHGIPVLAYRARKFDPEYAFHLSAKHQIRNAFLPPTALKMMRQVERPRKRHRFNFRSIASAGEALGAELLQWGREAMGVTINEFYGQTEVNLVVANCAEILPVKPGSMGRAIPGHRVEIVNDQGEVMPPGQTGNIAIKRPDPVMFLEYWKNPQATRDKFIGDWSLTGDWGKKDEQGYFWFVGRQDDLITSSGYRIGPGEIEDCLIRHPAVALAAVIGKPDPLRTEIVKAFIVLKQAKSASDALRLEIQEYVRTRLAAHEYPREIDFVEELPMTATGKIIRKTLREREG